MTTVSFPFPLLYYPLSDIKKIQETEKPFRLRISTIIYSNGGPRTADDILSSYISLLSYSWQHLGGTGGTLMSLLVKNKNDL